MKQLSLFTLTFFLTTLLLSATSCNKIKDAVAQNIPDITYEDDKPVITLPASSNLAQQTVFGVQTFDLNDYISKNGGGSSIGFSNVKHIYVTAITATVLNGDASNNFNNLTFTPDSSPVLIFNTTPNVSTATVLGGNITTPPADPYNLVIPVTNNTDILSHINGKDWAYGLSFKLKKATTKDLQIKLDVKYDISFKN